MGQSDQYAIFKYNIMKHSAFLRWNIQDLIKGAIMAGGGAAYAIIEPLLSTGNFEINWGNVIKIGAGTAVVYLFKNFLTPTPKTIEIDPTKTEIKYK